MDFFFDYEVYEKTTTMNKLSVMGDAYATTATTTTTIQSTKVCFHKQKSEKKECPIQN